MFLLISFSFNLPNLALTSDFSEDFLPGLRPLLPPSFLSRDPSWKKLEKYYDYLKFDNRFNIGVI